MSQLSMLDSEPEKLRRIPYRGKAPFVKGSDTSEAAAESIEPRKGNYQYEVLRYIRQMRSWGSTADQVEEKLGIPLNTVRPRLRELEDMGFIVKTPTKRPTRSGRGARVYVSYEYRGAHGPAVE